MADKPKLRLMMPPLTLDEAKKLINAIIVLPDEIMMKPPPHLISVLQQLYFLSGARWEDLRVFWSWRETSCSWGCVVNYISSKEEEDCVSFVQRVADCRKQHITNIIVCYKDMDNPLLNITFN